MNATSLPTVVSLADCGRFVAALVVFATVGACASTIASIREPATATFTIGVTQKSEVLAVLGLPALRKIEEGHEYWGYSKGPTVVAVTVPTHLSGNVVTLSTYRWHAAARAHYVYVFDPKGTLVHSQRPQ